MPRSTRYAVPVRALAAALTTLAVLAGLLVGGGAATAAPAARTFSAPVEALAAYEAPTTCDPTEKPGTVALRTLVQQSYPDVNSHGITRSCDVGGRSEHKEGRAWDWMLDASDPVEAARAQDFLTWLLATDAQGNRYAMARRLGVMYVIWNAKVWEAYDAAAGWTDYTGPVPHTDHIHLSLSWAGALKQTSFWATSTTSPTPAPTTSPTPKPTVSPAPAPAPTAPADVAPFGALDSVVAEGSAARVRGWAIDRDASTFTSVVVAVDAAPVRTAVADLHSDYLVTAQPDYSPRHAFDVLTPVAAGSRSVCVTALDQNQGGDRPLGCRTITVAAPAPVPTPAATAAPAPTTPPTTSTSVAPPPTRLVDQSCPAGRVPASSFADIATSVHAASIDCVVWWRVASGADASSYRPAASVTRAQMASFLARTVLASGGELPLAPPDAFSDDEGTGTHEHAINQLAAVGISSGRGGGLYDPAGIVTRGQMATFLAKAWGYRTNRSLPVGADYFSDDDGTVHEAAIGKVARAGFTGGTATGQFSPSKATDRGQMATFLARLLDLLVEAGDAPAHA